MVKNHPHLHIITLFYTSSTLTIHYHPLISMVSLYNQPVHKLFVFLFLNGATKFKLFTAYFQRIKKRLQIGEKINSVLYK
jgi:hypothetical protein